MSKISVDVNSARIPVLQVGYQGENEVTDVLFDISSWITEFGEGVAQLRVKRPGNSEEESYVLSLTITDGKAVWTVSETDTANKGNGKVQLSYLVGNIVKKAVIYPYKVGKSIVGADNPVDPFDSWIERSKAWAIGETLDGYDVPETDETYQNNAKYYAEQADILGSAQVVLAAEQATLATEKATLATEKADAAAESEANAASSEAAVNGVSTQLTTRMSAIETEQAVQDARMDTFASLPEGSTSGNAELADIRVGADGTTYDTAGNAVRGQISGLKSDLGDLQDFSYIKILDIQNCDVVNGWKLDSNGNFARDDNYTMWQYPVTANARIYVKSQSVFKFETGLSGDTVGSAFNNEFNGFVDVPESATYIAISKLKTDESSGLYEVYNDTEIENRNSKLGAYLLTRLVDGYYNTSGKLLDKDAFITRETYPIRCNEGDEFKYYGQCATTVPYCLLYSKDGTLVESLCPTTNGLQTINITIPQGVNSVIFASYNSGKMPMPLTLDRAKEEYSSHLSKKKWFACGDSFTAGGYGSDKTHRFTDGKYIYKEKVYPYFIGNRTNCDVKNIAVAGMTLAVTDGTDANFTNTAYANNYTVIDTDSDIVTLYFGINDSGRNIPLGNIEDTDVSTFYGAYNTVLDYIVTNCTKAHIGIIVSNSLEESFVNATINIAKKWGIPYLDLNYDESVPLMSDSLRPNASDTVKAKRNARFRISEDNHHPNELAHEYESYFIEEWLKTL